MSRRVAINWVTKTILLLAVLGLAAGPAAGAQPDPEPLPQYLRFEPFPLETLAPGLRVSVMFQDRQGFLWLGSASGLHRYDGHELKPYPRPDGSLAGEPRQIVQDLGGFFWLAADDGLERFDPRRAAWTAYRHRAGDPGSLAAGPVSGVAVDARGSIWVAAGESLDRLNQPGDDFTHFDLPGAGGMIFTLLGDHQGRLWLGAQDGGLHRFDPEQQEFQHFTLNSPAAGWLGTSPEVQVLLESPQGGLWLAVHGGVAHFDPASGRVTWLPQPGGLAADNRPAALAYSPGSLWLATLAGGLFRYDTGAGRWNRYTFERTDPFSLSEDALRALLVDQAGSLWVVTQSGRVDHHDPRRGFRNIQPQRGNPNSLSDAIVSAVAAGPDGRLWTGTQRAGLNAFDPKTGEWAHYRRNLAGDDLAEGGPGLNDDRVTALAFDSTGRLWVGTGFGGLNRLDLASGQWTRYEAGSGPGGLADNAVRSLLAAQDGVVWIGTEAGVLDRLEPESGEVRHYRPPESAADPNRLKDMITALAEDPAGDLWVGLNRGAVYRFDPERGAWSQDWLAGDAARPVAALQVDREGRAWAGTRGGGLVRLGDAPGAFQRYGEAEGLPDADIVSLQFDLAGALWLGTPAGLARFDPHTAAVENFTTADGLPGGPFSPRAAALLEDGTLIFGSASGLTQFEPQGVGHNPSPPPVAITGFQLFYQPVEPGRLAWEPDGSARLRLQSQENVFSIDYAALDFAGPERSRYAYQLAGPDPQQARWVSVGSRRQAVFTNLAPGRYTFRVMAVGQDAGPAGEWSAPSPPLYLEIQPPFWQTPAFRFSVGALLVGSLGLGAWRRTRQLEVQKQRLETQVANRTHQLNEALAELERSRAAAERAAVMEERQRLARELHDSVTQLLYGQVLSADIGQKYLHQGDLERLDQKLGEMSSISIQALREMRLLLYELRPSFFEEEGLVNALELRLDAVERRSHLEAELEAAGDFERLPQAASWEVYRLAIEALNNVLKHAAAGQVWVRLSLAVQGGRGRLELVVQDDGRGFDPDNPAGSGGLGLRSMAQRAQLLNGRLTITSQPGQGTQVRLLAEVDLLRKESEG